MSFQGIEKVGISVKLDGKLLFGNDIQVAELFDWFHLLAVEGAKAGDFGMIAKDSLSGADVDVVDA